MRFIGVFDVSDSQGDARDGWEISHIFKFNLISTR